MFYFVNYLCINLMAYITKSYIYDNYYKKSISKQVYLNECAHYSDLIKRLPYTKCPPPSIMLYINKCVDIYPENEK